MKDVVISLRVSKSEHEYIRQKAMDRNMSVSDYMRNRALQDESFGIKGRQILCGGLTRIKDGIYNDDLDDVNKAVTELWQLLKL